MSQHKDKVTGKWYYTGKYRDMLGKRHDYKKRGFATKKEAKDAEITFLQKLKGGYGRISLRILQSYITRRSQNRKKALQSKPTSQCKKITYYPTSRVGI